MSKPTKRQIEVIDHVVDIVRGWDSTNDLHSPSHYTEIDAIGQVLDGLNERQVEDVEAALRGLLNAIARIDPCQHRNP